MSVHHKTSETASGGQGRLVADHNQIARFVVALFKHAPSGSFVSLRAFYDKGEARDGPAYRRFEAVSVDNRQHLIERACACATWAANQPNRIVFCPPIATFRTGDNATTANLAAGLALSVECDRNAPSALALLTGLLGPTTLAAASGGVEADGVTPKLHLHWRLRRPATTPDEFEKLKVARQLACALVGGDHTNISLVHPIRWPGSWHRKTEPRMARIVEAHDVDIDLDDAYRSLYDAANARGLVEVDDSRRGTGNPEKMASSIDDVAMWLQHIPNPMEPDTWHTWNNVAMATWGATCGCAEGLDLFLQWSARHPAYGGPIHQARAAARWRHLHKHPPTRIGAGRLYFLFTEYVNYSDLMRACKDDAIEDDDVIEGDLS